MNPHSGLSKCVEEDLLSIENQQNQQFVAWFTYHGHSLQKIPPKGIPELFTKYHHQLDVNFIIGIFRSEKRNHALPFVTGWFSTPIFLLICSWFSRENYHPLLICSSLSVLRRCSKPGHFRHQARQQLLLGVPRRERPGPSMLKLPTNQHNTCTRTQYI